MKKAVLSFVFIGVFSWFGLFGEEAPKDDGESQRTVVVKRPVKW